METKELSRLRVWVLRGMYAFMAVGLIVTQWPSILSPAHPANEASVIHALLGAIAVLSLGGLFQPVRMIPLLIFELVWKVIWVLGTAVPLLLGPGLDAYGSATLFATMMGVVLVPLVLPWGFVWRTYLAARPESTRGNP